MISESSIQTYFNQDQGFVLQFFDGQKVVHDLAMLHDIKGAGFSFYRNTILSFIHVVSFSKGGEQYGLFIDSTLPPFQFKLEVSHSGYYRSLLLPEEFNSFPTELVGTLRLVKTAAGMKPYTSIMQLDKTPPMELLNELLQNSFQVSGETYTSDLADQSFLLLSLPPLNVNKEENKAKSSLHDFKIKVISALEETFKSGTSDEKLIEKELTQLGFTFLKKKDIQFQCNCSQERMELNFSRISNAEQDELYQEHGGEIVIKCDYCKKSYSLVKK